MAHTKSVIELNGKKYDAVSGKMLSEAAPQPKVTVHNAAAGKKAPAPRSAGTNMDGFVRSSAVSVHPTPAQKAKTTTTAQKPSHTTRKPQAAKTLMRSAVKKPSSSAHTKTFSGVSTPLDHAVTTPTQIQEKRAQQAHKIAQSPLISRFGFGPKPVTKTTKHLPVTPMPAHVAPVHKQAPPLTASTRHTPTKHANATQSTIAAAMEKSTSHNKNKLAKTKTKHKVAHKLGVSSRFVSTAAASLSILLLVGFFAYQNIPNIAVRMAANKAGFSARLPEYQPSGFAVSGPVQAAPGVVTINFASNSDGRNFQISQRPSEWNSESLLNNFVATLNQPYQTFQEAGRTIYMYNDSSATWVSGGVWYQIDGKSNLNSDQLLRVASSL
ncbi:hypothetical protein KA047_00970 [Candidatus Saccharibacteria bacterium]|nr:hypothetical protein [Candidatus Saccharibacteria bacterium]